MKAWWSALTERERLALLFALWALLFAGLYLGLFTPYVAELSRLRETRAALSADLAWMARTVEEIDAGADAPSRKDEKDSVLALVDQTATQAGLKSAISRLTPVGDDKVRIWMTDARHDQLIDWLRTVGQRYGISVEEATLEVGKVVGVVKVTMLVRR